jgi:DNA-binding NtrC family response regulator
MKSKILIIEDDTNLASSLKRLIELEGYDVQTVADPVRGLATAAITDFDVVITDLQFSNSAGAELAGGLKLIRELNTAKPHLPIILMTAHHSTDVAIEATKLGAYDYLTKPFDPQTLLDLVEKAVESRRLMSEPVELGASVPTGDAIIGNSLVMQRVYKEIGRVATRPVTVLIRGETGTGKELVARAIYHHSTRSQQAFVIVNCAAIPETLLESELFGHEQGAFTGAATRRIGKFEQANHGVIFLDEIGDMSINTQAKLLRVLQNRTIQRLGGKETIPIDVRILAATHRDLEAAIRDKQFREDLFYRLNDAVIFLPPLRERQDDIPALVSYFLQRHGLEFGFPNPTISGDAMEQLQNQSWPGNVRELENVIRKALLVSQGYTITPPTILQILSRSTQPRPALDQTLGDYLSDLLARAMRGELENVQAAFTWDVERELYSRAIQLANGNQARAARWLGVSRPTMREKLRAYGLKALPETP